MRPEGFSIYISSSCIVLFGLMRLYCMLCSDIVSRGRQFSDLQNSKFIDRDDEVGSLNEGYKDLYALMCESDDDYFVTEVIYGLSPTYLTAPNTWDIPLPEDFFKLRSVDFKGNENWREVNKYPMSGRNEGAGDLAYRLTNNVLRLIGNNSVAASGSIRVRYYPPAQELSVPDITLYGGYGLTLAQVAGITWPCYNAERNTLIYAYAGNIVAESLSLKTRVTLCAVAAPSYIRYYRGTLYYVSGGQIFSAASDLSSAIVPAAIVGPANVVSLEVWDQKLYYCEHPAGYITYVKSTLGGAAAALGAFESYNISKYAGGYLYRDGTGLLTYSGGATLPGFVCTGLTTDPDGNVYLQSGTTLGKYQLNTTIAVVNSWVLGYDVSQMGPWDGYYIPGTAFQKSQVFALSSYENTDLTYPTNLLPEVISLQCGADFTMKQKGDTTAITARRNEKLAEFLKYFKRDSYQTERISQYYTPKGGLW